MKKLIAIILTALFVISCVVVVQAGDWDEPYHRILYIPKADTTPNLEKIDDTWGEPLIHVTADLPDAVLFKYWQQTNPSIGISVWDSYIKKGRLIDPEPADFWFYCRWDEKNIYLAFYSPEEETSGWIDPWCGDGIQMWIKHRNGVEDPYEHYYQGMYHMCWTLGMDDFTVQYYDHAIEWAPYLEVEDGYMTATIKIPFTDIGIRKSDVKDGLPLALVMNRITSRDASIDLGYAGYLQWGFEYVITLVLDDPAVENQPLETIAPVNGPPVYDSEHPGETISQHEETEPVTTDDTTAEAEINLDGVSSWALTEVEAGIKEGLVPENLRANYTSPVSRGAVAGMFINLIEKATGKTIDAIMAEKGVSITEGVFEDTTDRNVLAANALGIINGTSKTKFSPDGTLKRAQIAAIINRVARVLGINTDGFTHEFNDITGNYAWADSELGWPVHAGIVNGVGQGRFNPGGDLTTEQAILITYRALGALK